MIRFFISIAVLFSAICLVWTVCNDNSKIFDSAEWKNNANSRYKMVNNIISDKLFIGKTKNEIIQILGRGFEEGLCDNCIGYSTNDPNTGFSIDHDVLAIYFDKSDKVIEIRSDMW